MILLADIVSGISGGPPLWLAIPFVLLLLLIATGPVFFSHFWHSGYKTISVLLGVFVLGCYFLNGDFHEPQQTFFEYFSFISLLAALYVASGGIYIETNLKQTPLTNVVILLTGALLANLIGTTGASILLIRPFIRLNQHRMKPYLIVFFIFLVSNIGGTLAPMGPPLFLGFLHGVPFLWMIHHLSEEWIFAVVLLLFVFFLFDVTNKKQSGTSVPATGKIRIEGSKNFLWLLLIVLTVFLDPAKINGLPSLNGNSFLREIIQITIAFVCYRSSSKKALQFNRFHWEPILEVGFLFFGIFFTMMPAMELLSELPHSLNSEQTFSLNFFYWGTGFASSFLDNAPAYLTFLTLAMSTFNLSVNDTAAVIAFSQHPEYIHYLAAISTASVFFGAMTYIGNGPNFMVIAIAEDMNIEIPSFFGYLIKFAIPILLPIMVIVWWIFI